MRRVWIQEVTGGEGAQQRSIGRAYEGWEDTPPKIGEPYSLAVESGRVFKTSPVVKVLDGYLVTQNSLYKFVELDSKPFYLEGRDSQTTQELVFPQELLDAGQDDGFNKLSPREKEVFQLLAEGLSIRKTAELLFISPKTVEAHKYHVMEKLGIRTMNELIKEAIRRGLVQVKS